MKSVTTARFRKAYNDLQGNVKEAARRTYNKWKENPNHSSLQFKQIHNTQGLGQNKVHRIDAVILSLFKAQIAANSRASISKICNAEKRQKNKSKWGGCFVPSP